MPVDGQKKRRSRRDRQVQMKGNAKESGDGAFHIAEKTTVQHPWKLLSFTLVAIIPENPPRRKRREEENGISPKSTNPDGAKGQFSDFLAVGRWAAALIERMKIL